VNKLFVFGSALQECIKRFCQTWKALALELGAPAAANLRFVFVADKHTDHTSGYFPKQKNGIDCGVFATFFVSRLAHGLPVLHDTPLVRKSVAAAGVSYWAHFALEPHHVKRY
jgi:hypothetical protein